jgi:protein-L-isoaspartate(D-aspartate) O-methyltransferase
MVNVDFLSSLHKKTKRDYVARILEYPKAEAIKTAKKYSFDYWDGDRKFGYGGYKYDGRWRPVAEKIASHYNLTTGDKILDVGCGKAFLLYEFTQCVSGVDVTGIDISEYAIEHAKEEVALSLQVGNATELPFETNSFDLVISINTVHNLYCFDLIKALREIERVGKKHKYIVVESYRTEEEKVNLMFWVLTGECFFSTEEWKWWFDLCGYTGDYSFIFFE